MSCWILWRTRASKGLAYAERGFRNVTNSVRPVNNADDLAGLKLRVMENEVYTATFIRRSRSTPFRWPGPKR